MKTLFLLSSSTYCCLFLALTKARGHSTQSYSTRRTTVVPRRLVFASSIGWAPAAAVWATSTEELCQGNALAPETAVPGAYQQACMDLPYRLVPVPNKSPLKVYQKANTGNTGTVVWNSSLLLTRLIPTLDEIPGSTVLELGTGTGVASLMAAMCGARRVMATDGNPSVVRLAQSNVEANQLEKRVQTGVLPWGNLQAMEAYESTADIVLGSDLTYFAGNWPSLAETMATTLKDTGYVLYLSLGHPGFSATAELDGFLAVAKAAGLVPVTRKIELTESYLTNRLLLTLTTDELRMVRSSGVRVVALCHDYNQSLAR